MLGRAPRCRAVCVSKRACSASDAAPEHSAPATDSASAAGSEAPRRSAAVQAHRAGGWVLFGDRSASHLRGRRFMEGARAESGAPPPPAAAPNHTAPAAGSGDRRHLPRHLSTLHRPLNPEHRRYLTRHLSTLHRPLDPEHRRHLPRHLSTPHRPPTHMTRHLSALHGPLDPGPACEPFVAHACRGILARASIGSTRFGENTESRSHGL